MAKNTIAMEVNLRKNENSQNAGYGKYYFEVARKPTLSLKGFAKHMSDHGCIYGRDIIEGVLKKITQCLPELVSQGVPVQLEPLGTFSPSLKNKKAGLTLTQLLAGNWDINQQVEGVKFNFLPYSVADENLTSRKFKEEWCTLELTDVVKSRKETVNGKEKRFVEKTPWETWIHDQGGSNNGGTGGTGTINTGGDSNGGSDNGGGTSQGGGTGTINTGGGSQSETVNAPAINGNTSFAESTQVTMTGPDGAEIRYTTDGSTPTSESTLYSEAITLSATTTVKAIAIKDGVSSEVASKTFTKSEGGDDSE